MTNPTDSWVLKPCPNPWCKEGAPALMLGGFRNRMRRVQCETCGMAGPQFDDIAGDRAAVDAWNKRAPTPPAAEPSSPSLHAAVHAFLAKIDECQSHIDDAFFHRQLRCGPYTGPQYGQELKVLREALRQRESRVAADGEALREAAQKLYEDVFPQFGGWARLSPENRDTWMQRVSRIVQTLSAEPAVQREELDTCGLVYEPDDARATALESARVVLQAEGDGTYEEALAVIRELVAVVKGEGL